MYMKWAKMEAKKCSNSKYSRIKVGEKLILIGEGQNMVFGPTVHTDTVGITGCCSKEFILAFLLDQTADNNKLGYFLTVFSQVQHRHANINSNRTNGIP